MTIIAFLSVFVCIIGLLMYFVSGNPKVVETGRLMFACGLLVSLLLFGNDAGVNLRLK